MKKWKLLWEMFVSETSLESHVEKIAADLAPFILHCCPSTFSWICTPRYHLQTLQTLS